MDGEILLIFTFSQQDKRISAGGVLPAFRGFSQVYYNSLIVSVTEIFRILFAGA